MCKITPSVPPRRMKTHSEKKERIAIINQCYNTLLLPRKGIQGTLWLNSTPHLSSSVVQQSKSSLNKKVFPSISEVEEREEKRNIKRRQYSRSGNMKMRASKKRSVYTQHNMITINEIFLSFTSNPNNPSFRFNPSSHLLGLRKENLYALRFSF